MVGRAMKIGTTLEEIDKCLHLGIEVLFIKPHGPWLREVRLKSYRKEQVLMISKRWSADPIDAADTESLVPMLIFGAREELLKHIEDSE